MKLSQNFLNQTYLDSIAAKTHASRIFHLTSLLIMIKVSLSNVNIFSYISLTLLFDVVPQSCGIGSYKK